MLALMPVPTPMLMAGDANRVTGDLRNFEIVETHKLLEEEDV